MQYPNFIEWFSGVWTNRIQHFHDIRKHTLVTLEHDYLGDNTFLFRQKRFEEIYRTGHYKLIFEEDGTITFQNYDINMEYKQGCDIVFQNRFPGIREGGRDREYWQGTPNGECITEFEGVRSLFRTDAKLYKDRYMVWDRGFDPEAPGRMIWGSSFGPYIFRRPDFDDPDVEA